MIERAIVQDVVTGRGGQTVRQYQRPKEVRATAQRLASWRTRTPERCVVCHETDASVIRSGQPLCLTCRAGAESRAVAVFSERGVLRPAPTRHHDPEAVGIVGHFIVFNSRSVDLGGFTEIIRPPAVDRSLADGHDIRALWSHDTSQSLGRTGPRTLQLRKDRTGLYGAIDTPRWAEHYLETVERGDVTAASFGFRVLEDEWIFADDLILREVLDMELIEVSPVAFPAYPETSIRVERLSARRERETLTHIQVAQ
jgi:hypothetical protein